MCIRDRYSNPKRYLLELKKEKESVYYLKEELQSNNGNKIIEYAYKLTYTYGYGYPGGRLGYWHYQKWKEYLNEQGQKGESDALVSADIAGEEF